MIVVDRPTLFHPQCLVTARGDDKHGPYIDLTRDFGMAHQGRMYISYPAVKSMVNTFREHGHEFWVDIDVHSAVLEELAEANSLIEQLETENNELSEIHDAVHTLKKTGFTAQKKPGPKPKVNA